MSDDTTPPTGGTLNILDPSGHSALAWRTDDPASVAAAEARFNALVGPSAPLQYAAFRTDPGGTTGEQIFAFEASAPAITLVPPLAGG